MIRGNCPNCQSELITENRNKGVLCKKCGKRVPIEKLLNMTRTEELNKAPLHTPVAKSLQKDPNTEAQTPASGVDQINNPKGNASVPTQELTGTQEPKQVMPLQAVVDDPGLAGEENELDIEDEEDKPQCGAIVNGSQCLGEIDLETKLCKKCGEDWSGYI